MYYSKIAMPALATERKATDGSFTARPSLACFMSNKLNTMIIIVFSLIVYFSGKTFKLEYVSQNSLKQDLNFPDSSFNAVFSARDIKVIDKPEVFDNHQEFFKSLSNILTMNHCKIQKH